MSGYAKKIFKSDNHRDLHGVITVNEEWLIRRILHYATLYDFTKYTSTLHEAWRASIEGISASILDALEYFDDVPEFGPEEDWQNDPCGKFGQDEAELHRKRGVPLAMFLGLMKYYRQSYIDLLKEETYIGDPDWAELFINRLFDRIEISFCQSWSGIRKETLIEDLQKKNRLLVNEKNKFLTLFESYSMPCFFVDQAGSIDSMNLAAAKAFDYSLAPGQHYYRHSNDEKIPPWLQTEIEAFMGGVDDDLTFEKKSSRGDDYLVYVVHFKRMLDVSKKFSGVVVSLADVTQRTKAKILIEEAHKNLIIAQDQILQREKMASLGRLVAGMAHEINNPLATILQSVQIVEQRLNPCLPRNKKVAEEVNIELGALVAYLSKQNITKLHLAIKDAGCKTASIVKRLLEFRNQDTQPPALTDPCEVAERAVVSFKNDMNFRQETRFLSIDIVKNFEEKIPRIFCNHFQLHQALLSIMNNAVEAMSDIRSGNSTACCIWLRVAQENNNVLIEIKDNGPGMPEHVQKNIFEPFFTTKETGSGIGLGLSMVYKFVETSHGTIDMKSSPGQGCRVIMMFPAS